MEQNKKKIILSLEEVFATTVPNGFNELYGDLMPVLNEGQSTAAIQTILLIIVNC